MDRNSNARAGFYLISCVSGEVDDWVVCPAFVLAIAMEKDLLTQFTDAADGDIQDWKLI